MRKEIAWEAQLAALRTSFDEGFAAPPSPAAGATDGVLLIRVGAERLAVKVREITGLEARRKVVPLPVAAGALSGLAAVRGRLVPVYSLATLLRCERGDDEERWLLLCEADGPLALAFPTFDGYARVPRADLGAALRVASELRTVLDVPAIVAALRTQLPEATSGDRTK